MRRAGRLFHCCQAPADRTSGAQPPLRPLHLVVRETEFCGQRLAGDFSRRMRENGRNSVRRPRHASLTDRNCEGFCGPETASVCRYCMVERDGFEPEISLAVLPNTQSELPFITNGGLAEGFRTAALCRRAGLGAGPASESLVRRKPRGGRGAVWLGGTYGDLKVGDGSPMWRRGREAGGVIVGSEHDALFRGRGCERRLWARRLERVCGGCEDIGFLLRRAVGDEDDRRCAAGSSAIVMRCRS